MLLSLIILIIKAQSKKNTEVCVMPTWRLAEMFVQSNAYKFKEDADEIGEDSGRSHRNY